MKIIMVGPHKDKVKGGMSTVIKGYYNSDLVNKYEFISINTVIDGCKFIKLLCFFYSYAKMIFCLMFNNIDLVHVHVASRKSFYRKSIYIKLAKVFKRKIVLHMHGGGFDTFYWKECNDKKRKKITRILNMGDVIIALGESWKSKISRYCSTSISVVYNSVNVENQNLYNQNSKNVLFLGRLEKQKGIFDLIKAAQFIIKQDKDIKFLLAGNGDLSKIMEVLKAKKIKENFKLLGWVDSYEVKRLLKDSMAFVLPSYNEGMPISILEAMSFGVPVISTNVGSIPEIIKNRINGFLIKPGDIKGISKSILYINKNYNKKIKISNKNFEDVSKKYSNDVNYKALSDLYESLLIRTRVR
jgi:glycosyltransferase involved in cell wall biosynthesis